MGYGEYQGLGYCIGLLSANGADTREYERLADWQHRTFRGYFDRTGYWNSVASGRAAMRLSHGMRRQQLMDTLHETCPRFSRYFTSSAMNAAPAPSRST